MTLGIGTLPSRRQPVRVISAVYPVQTPEQRRHLAHNASHAGRLVAVGVALLITAVAVFSAGGSNNSKAASSAGGLPGVVPEACSAPSSVACQDVVLRSGFCSVSYITDVSPSGYEVAMSSEGRA